MYILLVAATHDILVTELDCPFKAGTTLIVFTIALSTVILPPLMPTVLEMPGKKLLT